MGDIDTMANAILDIELILSDYLEPGPREAEKTIHYILERLDRDDVTRAAERVQAGFGQLRVVK